MVDVPAPAPASRPGHSRVILMMIAVFVAMVGLSVFRISVAPNNVPVHLNASPHGYTWSLSLSLLPLTVLMLWFRRERTKRPADWRAFRQTAAVVFVVWGTLDILLANTIFHFPNPSATLPWRIPGLHLDPLGWKCDIPLEELVFYLSTVLVMVLIYIWSSAVWFAPPDEARYREEGRRIKRAIQFQGWHVQVGYAAALFLAVWAYKKFGWHPYNRGFPIYAFFLIMGVLAPNLIFWQTVRTFVNQRALVFTMMTVILVSLLWEVTLGIPYGWWGYRMDAMMGIRIRPWFDLPVEAVFLWVVSGWGNVTLYELLKLRAASERNLGEFLTGREMRLRRR